MFLFVVCVEFVVGEMLVMLFFFGVGWVVYILMFNLLCCLVSFSWCICVFLGLFWFEVLVLFEFLLEVCLLVVFCLWFLLLDVICWLLFCFRENCRLFEFVFRLVFFRVCLSVFWFWRNMFSVLGCLMMRCVWILLLVVIFIFMLMWLSLGGLNCIWKFVWLFFKWCVIFMVICEVIWLDWVWFGICRLLVCMVFCKVLLWMVVVSLLLFFRFLDLKVCKLVLFVFNLVFRGIFEEGMVESVVGNCGEVCVLVLVIEVVLVVVVWLFGVCGVSVVD